MRINQKMVELRAIRLNKEKKILHLCHRNNYYAIDNAEENECYECGLSTREAFLVMKGIEIGMEIALKN